MTTPATERRAFLFEPTNRERPPSRAIHRSEEHLHLDLNGDASTINHSTSFPPQSPDTPATPSKAYLKNYHFPPIASDKPQVLDYPSDELYDAMGNGRPRGESDLGRPALRSRAPSTTYGLAAIPAEYEPDTPVIRRAPTDFE